MTITIKPARIFQYAHGKQRETMSSAKAMGRGSVQRGRPFKGYSEIFTNSQMKMPLGLLRVPSARHLELDY